jgi:hypothetical protein
VKLAKRQARAKARAKTMRIRKQGVPCTSSKFGMGGTWDGQGLTPGEVQSARKQSRRDAEDWV